MVTRRFPRLPVFTPPATSLQSTRLTALERRNAATGVRPLSAGSTDPFQATGPDAVMRHLVHTNKAMHGVADVVLAAKDQMDKAREVQYDEDVMVYSPAGLCLTQPSATVDADLNVLEQVVDRARASPSTWMAGPTLPVDPRVPGFFDPGGNGAHDDLDLWVDASDVEDDLAQLEAAADRPDDTYVPTPRLVPRQPGWAEARVDAMRAGTFAFPETHDSDGSDEDDAARAVASPPRKYGYQVDESVELGREWGSSARQPRRVETWTRFDAAGAAPLRQHAATVGAGHAKVQPLVAVSSSSPARVLSPVKTPREFFGRDRAEQKAQAFNVYHGLRGKQYQQFNTESAMLAHLSEMDRVKAPPEVVGLVRAAHDTLDVSAYGVGDVVGGVLCKSLAFMRDLGVLLLPENRLSHIVVPPLAASLSGSALRVLHLGRNRLRQRGADALARGLPRMPHLTTLNVEDNGIPDAGMRAICVAVRSVRTLRTLILRRNAVGTKACRALAVTVGGSLPKSPGERRRQLAAMKRKQRENRRQLKQQAADGVAVDHASALTEEDIMAQVALNSVPAHPALTALDVRVGCLALLEGKRDVTDR